MTGKFLFMRYLVFRTDKYPVSAMQQRLKLLSVSFCRYR